MTIFIHDIVEKVSKPLSTKELADNVQTKNWSNKRQGKDQHNNRITITWIHISYYTTVSYIIYNIHSKSWRIIRVDTHHAWSAATRHRSTGCSSIGSSGNASPIHPNINIIPLLTLYNHLFLPDSTLGSSWRRRGIGLQNKGQREIAHQDESSIQTTRRTLFLNNKKKTYHLCKDEKKRAMKQKSKQLYGRFSRVLWIWAGGQLWLVNYSSPIRRRMLNLHLPLSNHAHICWNSRSAIWLVVI